MKSSTAIQKVGGLGLRPRTETPSPSPVQPIPSGSPGPRIVRYSKEVKAPPSSRRYRFVKDGLITAVLESTGRLLIKDGEGNLEAHETYREYFKNVKNQTPPSPVNFGDVLDALAKELGEPVLVGDSGIEPYKGNGNGNPGMEIGTSNRILTKGSNRGTMEVKMTEKSDDDNPEGGSAPETEDEEMKNATARKASPMLAPKGATGGTRKRKAEPAPKHKKSAGTKATSKAKEADAGPLPNCKCGCPEQVGSRKSTFLPGHDARFHGWIKKIKEGRMKISDIPYEEGRANVRKELKNH